MAMVDHHGVGGCLSVDRVKKTASFDVYRFIKGFFPDETGWLVNWLVDF